MRLNFLSFLLVIPLLSGCGFLHKSNGVFGKASRSEDKAEQRIQKADNAIADVNIQRLNSIGQYSLGTDYSLSKETNADAIVTTAKELNERVISLANKPNLVESIAIKELVDLMITNVVAGEKALVAKDSEINSLQSKVVTLNKEKDAAVKSYIQIADRAASQLDKDTAQLSKYTSYFGLGAIFLGMGQLVKSLAWFLGIGTVLFIILRYASMVNPIAATIFAVFEHLISYVLKAIVSVFPKALSFAGYVEQKIELDVPKIISELKSEISGSK